MFNFIEHLEMEANAGTLEDPLQFQPAPYSIIVIFTTRFSAVPIFSKPLA